MRFAFCSLLAVMVVACGGSTFDVASDEDTGADATADDVAVDSGTDAQVDSRPSVDSTSADTSPEDSAPTADTRTDTAPDVIGVDVPPPIDGGTDSRPPPPDATSDVPVIDAPIVDSGTCSSGGSVCGLPLSCCGGKCVYEMNDPHNCGGCGVECAAPDSMCIAGACKPPDCAPACPGGSSCCAVSGPGPTRPPACYAGDRCPIGCPLCL